MDLAIKPYIYELTIDDNTNYSDYLPPSSKFALLQLFFL
jgi:hypothetical protein